MRFTHLCCPGHGAKELGPMLHRLASASKAMGWTVMLVSISSTEYFLYFSDNFEDVGKINSDCNHSIVILHLVSSAGEMWSDTAVDVMELFPATESHIHFRLCCHNFWAPHCEFWQCLWAEPGKLRAQHERRALKNNQIRYSHPAKNVARLWQELDDGYTQRDWWIWNEWTICSYAGSHRHSPWGFECSFFGFFKLPTLFLYASNTQQRWFVARLTSSCHCGKRRLHAHLNHHLVH